MVDDGPGDTSSGVLSPGRNCRVSSMEGLSSSESSVCVCVWSSRVGLPRGNQVDSHKIERRRDVILLVHPSKSSSSTHFPPGPTTDWPPLTILSLRISAWDIQGLLQILGD